MAGALGVIAAISACDAAPSAPPAPPAPPAADTLVTVAGSGISGFAGDGQAALQAQLDTPIDVAFDSAGRALVIDWHNHRLRRIDADGLIETVMGTGDEEYGAANVPARDFPIHHPFDLAVTPEGEWLLAGYHDPRVLRVDLGDRVRVLAGFGAHGDGGDGGPATLASFDAPSGVARGADGDVFVVDELRHRIRRVRADGTIEAFAGTGQRGYEGDGGPASMARLDGPFRVAHDASTGALYVCDTGNHAIRKIDASGVIHTFAGTGRPGFSGDGGPASRAELYRPIDLTLLDDGSVLVADSENHRIRRVASDGTISTLVGTGTTTFSGDGGPAAQAGLHTPWGIGVDREGRLWIADTGHHRVRRADPALLGGARLR